MIVIFWGATFLLLLIVFFFIYPWIRSRFVFWTIVIVLPLGAYPLYLKLGQIAQVKVYYANLKTNLTTDAQSGAKNEAQNQAQIDKMQRLLSMLRKQETRLRLKLEETPGDLLLQGKLLDVLAVMALQKGEVALAQAYWGEALVILKEVPEAQEFRNRILKFQQDFIK